MFNTYLNAIFQGPWFYVIAIWSLVWKGLTLWRAAKNNSKVWYVVLLVLNTLGILEILYYFVFSKKKNETKPITPTQ